MVLYFNVVEHCGSHFYHVHSGDSSRLETLNAIVTYPKRHAIFINSFTATLKGPYNTAFSIGWFEGLVVDLAITKYWNGVQRDPRTGSFFRCLEMLV